ncbi:hypothetical protein [uncultured Corynebacterium sp.]|uniref:hypothetical protein n=1 Tax=uncultured Corynebacterium sp. TaxID=159447 RepID=UPI0025F0229B|nr:hypothetical protein [uncultured Corynebacterium sp.]
MKSQKSTAVRSALAAVAAGSTLALTACGAGHISQTANQVPAVNGVFAQAGKQISLRDVAVVVDPNNKLSVKFTAGNTEEVGKKVNLQSVKVDGKEATLEGDKTVGPNCSLVADYKEAIQSMKKGGEKGTCNSFVTTSVSGVTSAHIGGQKEVEIKFDSGSAKVNAPVIAYTPKAGTLNRDAETHVSTDAPKAGSEHKH